MSITEGKCHDIQAARNIDLPRGSILAIDRGYNDYEWFNSLNDKDIFFVTRLKKNAKYTVVERRSCIKKNFPVVHKAVASKKNAVDMELLGIEIIRGCGESPAKANHQVGVSVIDTDDAGVHRLSLKPDQQNMNLHCEAPFLVVSTSASAEIEDAGSSHRIAPGECRYFDAGTWLAISNSRSNRGDLLMISVT